MAGKVKIGISILIVFVFSNSLVNAQTELENTNTASASLTLGITEVSLIRVNAPNISLQLNQREAGLSIETSKADSSARLYLSSLITADSRTLTAKITDGSVPAGTLLQLAALQPNANFVGNWGTVAPVITLDNTDRVFVNSIASCYSGTETNDGYPLKFIYSLDPNSAAYGTVRATTGTSVVVTLTLSAVAN